MRELDDEKIRQGVRLILEGIGEDPERPGLVDTPSRVADLYREVTCGMDQNPADLLVPLHSEDHDEIVLVKDIAFHSLCEHHLIPFIGMAHVAYIPEGSRVVGISKLARVVEIEARKLQLQERMSTRIAEHIMHALSPKGVMVVVEAEHLCMTMRGVKKPGARTVTSVVRGIFRENAATRSECLDLIAGRR